MILINSCSSFAKEILCQVKSGYVHSVYRKTVNVIFARQMLSIQARDTIASPISLISNMDEAALGALHFQCGMEISLFEKNIHANGQMLDMTRCGIWDAELSEDRAGSIDAKYIENCLSALMPTGGFADLMLPGGSLWKQRLAAKEAAELLDSATASIRAGDVSGAANKLCELIGLGEGLTPSGDDFLCGVLAAAYLFGGNASELCGVLRPRITERLSQTNDISAAFLKCACAGQFSRPIIELQQNVDRERSRKSFSAIGHSSGADTLTGILYAARI